MTKTRREKRNRRKLHIRKNIEGTSEKPRVSIYKSNRYLFAQLVNDEEMKVCCGLSEKVIKPEKDEKPVDRAERMGVEFGKLIKKNKVETLVFDRAGYKYHGRIKAFAEGLRKSGFKF
ncbi:50S ribosomal protein L18 [Candidatus Dojkabacteria bacterium]|nr:50S ribosomal protein L18 [Candidatus Dojkabacteria bacterium]